MAYYGRHPNNYTNCKLKPDEVRIIRLWYDSKYKSISEIAKEFNIKPEAVRRIGKRERWTNISYQDDYDSLVREYTLKAKEENIMRNTRPNSKLSDAQVAEIRSETVLTNIQMGEKYKVSSETIRKTRNGQSGGGKNVDSAQAALTLLELGRESARRLALEHPELCKGIPIVTRIEEPTQLDGENYIDFMRRKYALSEQAKKKEGSGGNKFNPMDNPELGISHESFKLPEIKDEPKK